MAAYGALLSLTNTINQILDHPRPPISLDKIRIEPLMEKIAFLQDFLENYITDDDADGLEGRMIHAANEAEDIIESHVADHIRDEHEDSLYQHIQKLMMEESDEAEDVTESSQIANHIKVRGKGCLYRYLQKMIQKMTLCINNNSLKKDSIESHIADHIETRGEANITWNDDDGDSCLCRELHKVMYDFDSITKDVAAAIKDKARKKIADATTDDDVMNDDVILDKLTNNPYSEGAGGSNDVMIDVMGKLTDRQSSRWIIGIAGMGGIGKTTLAKNIYEHPLIVEHFDMRGWTTISQEYNPKRILLDVLDPLKNKVSEKSEYEELGKKLYQSLFGRRYLIVMDDIWGTDAWDEMKRFFPNNSNDGSRVLITTRASILALQLDGPDFFQMPFLKLDESWNLLRRCVFGEEQGCPPPELEEIGKNIATNCRGLPLSIVIIGGLLAKSEQTREKWQHILENLSSLVNLEEGERCFRILKLSYDQLPVHLKPCFLYMGMFPEDDKIHVTTLLKLWVDEGFVKPVAGNSLETIARAVYLNDLVLRNLIVVREWGCSQRIKRCSIHDLLRDLCIKEAERYKFFRTMEPTHNYYPDHHDQSWRAQRRISIIQHHAASERKHIHPRPLPKAVQSASRARTLICNTKGILPSLVRFKLLRVLNGYRVGELFHMANLRHLVISIGDRLPGLEFPPELYLLWNLRSLRLYLEGDYAPVLDIWRMPQLRYVHVIRFQLTDPPPPVDGENGCWMVLENLETLKGVMNLRLDEEVVDRIPNIKKLGIEYVDREKISAADFGLDNLWRLHKLESLKLFFINLRKSEVMVTLPISLRKLTLCCTKLGWEEMGTKIGSLPSLEVLKLYYKAFVGPEWETTEGGFLSLKYLQIRMCNLEQWRADALHFPRLEQIHLLFLRDLKEIPLEIGDINTLREINVEHCPDSVVLSAMKILEEQQECHGEVDLHIRVSMYEKVTKLQNLRSSRNVTVSMLK